MLENYLTYILSGEHSKIGFHCQKYMCAPTCVCARMCEWVCLHVCMCICVHVHVRACVRTCMHACVLFISVFFFFF